MAEVRTLLEAYVQSGDEHAFKELVGRYVNLVYSAALRLLNGDSHLAEDVAQKVFSDLARKASALPADVALGGWLHQHTCFIALNTTRGERRRKAREAEALEMIQDHDAANLRALAPVLDEAINCLPDDDKQAVVLRFFEQKDFRDVGLHLGSSEEAARKRVNRALEKLQSLLKRRGVALSSSAIASFLGSQAVVAAPAGLAASAAAAALAGAAAAAAGTASLSGGAIAGLLDFMGMTKIQTAVVGAVVLAMAIPLVMQRQTLARYKHDNERLRQQIAAAEDLASQNQALSNRLASAGRASEMSKEQLNELMRLRGEVGSLRKTVAETPTALKTAKDSMLSGITANPEMYKMIRDQQKLGLGMVYQGLTKQANLSEEKSKALVDLLADNVMTNIDHITRVLKEGRSPEEMEPVFAAQEAALKEQVKELLGPEGYAAYDTYTHNILSYLSAQQFTATLPGAKEAKEPKSRQLFELMQRESQQVLASAGLPPDYQMVPTLNFRNIASESEAEKNLKLLDSVYERVQQGAEFLSEEERTKFGEFRTAAINNNRLALTMNRKMMAPPPTAP